MTSSATRSIWMLHLRLGLALAAFASSMAIADLVEYEKIADKARSKVVDQFGKFTQDKNVMGKPQKPDKSANPGGLKTRFNQDDGVTYTSDLTHHKDAFDKPTATFDKKTGIQISSTDAAKKSQSEVEERTREGFVSEHGGLSADGGSSELERVAFKLHQERKKKDKENRADKVKQELKTGIVEDGIFRTTKKEAKLKNGAGGAGTSSATAAASPASGNIDTDTDIQKVERTELVEEAKEAIEKVGTNSFETVKRAGRDEELQNEEQSVANGLLVREAGKRALEALRNEALASVSQRRMRLGVEGSGLLGRIEPNEEAPTCEAAVDQKVAEIIKTDPKVDQAELQKDRQKVIEQCKEITKLNYQEVNPRFQAVKGSSNQMKIETGDIKAEDGRERDLRNQITVIDKAGIDPNELPSNWEYDESATKQKIAVEFGEGGKVTKEVEWTAKEQIESYNEQVRNSAQGLKDIATRLPEFNINADAVLKNQIEPGTRSAAELSSIPIPLMEEEYGVKTNPEEAGQPPPQSYDDLLKAVQK